jgi:hypothetical protein
MQVRIDGEPVYTVGRGSSRRRGHRLGQVRLPWTLTAGEHRLIIRTAQGRGAFEFSFNICEPIDDVRFAGNSYLGLDYHLPGAATELVVAATDRWADEGRDQSDGDPLELFFDPTDDALAPDSLVLVEPPAAPVRSDFIGVATRLAGIDVAPPVLDALAQMPFGMTPIGLDAILDESVALDERYGPGIDDLLDWVGVDYWGFYGHQPEKTQAMIRGLLSRGLVPVRGKDGGFDALIGYRQVTDNFEVRVSNQHSTTWQSLPDWWRNPWGNSSVWNSLFYVAAIGQPVTQEALIDSFAHIAVDMARRSTLEAEDPLRGGVTFPAGLAAWDESVVIWERMPLSASWGAMGRNRQLLSWLRRRHLEPLAQRRDTAAALFSWAATQAVGADRRHDLSTAAEGYASTASVLRDLGRRLP